MFSFYLVLVFCCCFFNLNSSPAHWSLSWKPRSYSKRVSKVGLGAAGGATHSWGILWVINLVVECLCLVFYLFCGKWRIKKKECTPVERLVWLAPRGSRRGLLCNYVQGGLSSFQQKLICWRGMLTGPLYLAATSEKKKKESLGSRWTFPLFF